MKKSSTLIQILAYIRPHLIPVILLCAIVMVGNSLLLVIPYLTGVMVDALHTPQGVDFDVIIRSGGVILIVSLVVWGITSLQNIYVVKIAQSVVVDLRTDTFKKLTKLPMSYFDNNTKGNIISILTTDIDNISELVSADAIVVLAGIVTIVGSLVMMLSISPQLSMIFLLTVPMMVIISRLISKRSRKRFRQKKNAYGRLCGYTEEMITAQKTVQVYGVEQYNVDKFKAYSHVLREKGEEAEFYSSMMMPAMNGINNFNFLLVCVMGSILAINGNLTVGGISTFIIYSKRFAHPIINIANTVNMLQSSLAACDRVLGILNEEEENTEEGLSYSVPQEVKGEIVFDNVSFSYTEESPVLENINLTVEQGEKVAIVGATGSGKTTLVSLLMRFYELSSGRITIDGQEIRDIPLKELRRYFALVLQDSWIFDGSIYENISYGATKEQKDVEYIERLCEEIEVADFIKTLPKGYQSRLKGDSEKLSAGQRQLISIARTFICNPSIFILDEATSSVDPQTEARIKVATDKVTDGKTSFIIAHRLSTIVNADKIVVMQKGRIREIGTHQELLKQGGLYKELYYSQFAGQVEKVAN